jgi:hypothetical protein
VPAAAHGRTEVVEEESPSLAASEVERATTTGPAGNGPPGPVVAEPMALVCSPTGWEGGLLVAGDGPLGLAAASAQ